MLIVGKTGRCRWHVHFSFRGRQREMSVGRAGTQPDRGEVGLTEARELRDEVKRLARNGTDPIQARRDNGQAEALGSEQETRFAEFALDYIARRARAKGWENPLTEKSWRNCLLNHCAALADMRLADIVTEHVLSCLQPIWLTIHETAQNTQERLHLVLQAATTAGLREGPNPRDGRIISNTF